MLSCKAQREGLKASGICEERPVKSHKPVQPTHPGNKLVSRLKVKVIGVGQRALHPEAQQVIGAQSPHAGQCCHWDQVRRLYVSAPGSDQPEPCIRFFVLL